MPDSLRVQNAAGPWARVGKLDAAFQLWAVPLDGRDTTELGEQVDAGDLDTFSHCGVPVAAWGPITANRMNE